MENQRSERRRSERIFFPAEIRETCILSHCKAKRRLNASVLNISLAGIGMASKREGCTGISVGDRLILAEVTGAIPLEFIENLELEIRWIGDNPMLEHVTFGCEFTQEIPETAHERLSELIETTLSHGLPMTE